MSSPWSTTSTGFLLVQSHFFLVHQQCPSEALTQRGKLLLQPGASYHRLQSLFASEMGHVILVLGSQPLPSAFGLCRRLIEERGTVWGNILQILDLSTMYFRPALPDYLGIIRHWVAAERAPSCKRLLLVLQHSHPLLVEPCFWHQCLSECFSTSCFRTMHLYAACNE